MNCLCYMPTTRKIGCTPRLNQFVSQRVVLYRNILCIKTTGKARFKRHATAVPNSVQLSVDRIKFDFSTSVARRLKPGRATAVYTAVARLGFKRRATAVPSSIHKFLKH